MAAKFVQESEYVFTLGEIRIDLRQKTVRRKTRRVVLELNQGFLCDMTLSNLLLFGTKKYSQELQEKELHPGHVLAQRLLETGIIMQPEQFILTFEFLVPNADVLLKYMQ